MYDKLIAKLAILDADAELAEEAENYRDVEVIEAQIFIAIYEVALAEAGRMVRRTNTGTLIASKGLSAAVFSVLSNGYRNSSLAFTA